MKRLSILATLIVSGLLAVAVLGAGSASAEVLCKDVHFDYSCPPEETYGVDTEFYAWDYGTVKLNAWTGGKFNMATCADSEFNWTITDAGGPNWLESIGVDTTNLGFENCGDDSMSVVSDGTGTISLYSFGGFKGYFHPQDLQVKVTTNWLYGDGKFDECVYKIKGAGVLAGWKADGSSVTKVVFTDAQAEKVSGTEGCFKTAYFSGQYNFPVGLNPFTSGQGIYVVQDS